MLIALGTLAVLSVAGAPSPASGSTPAFADCRASQLHLTTDSRDGDFNGMSHSGTELVLRNSGPDCRLAALPVVTLGNARGRPLPAERKPPVGMHPGPVMIPLSLPRDSRAVIDLRWVSGPVFDANRVMRATRVSIRVGSMALHAPLRATLYGQAGAPVTFEQTPARIAEANTAR